MVSSSKKSSVVTKEKYNLTSAATKPELHPHGTTVPLKWLKNHRGGSTAATCYKSTPTSFFMQSNHSIVTIMVFSQMLLMT